MWFEVGGDEGGWRSAQYIRHRLTIQGEARLCDQVDGHGMQPRLDSLQEHRRIEGRIQKAWDDIPVSTTKKLVGGMHRRMRKVIQEGGRRISA